MGQAGGGTGGGMQVYECVVEVKVPTTKNKKLNQEDQSSDEYRRAKVQIGLVAESSGTV